MRNLRSGGLTGLPSPPSSLARTHVLLTLVLFPCFRQFCGIHLFIYIYIYLFILPFFFCFVFFFLRTSSHHMEILRLGVELEPQLPAYATATAMSDLSHICKLHCSSWQRWSLNPLNKARDQTHILTNTILVYNPLSHHQNSHLCHLNMILESFFALTDFKGKKIKLFS